MNDDEVKKRERERQPVYLIVQHIGDTYNGIRCQMSNYTIISPPFSTPSAPLVNTLSLLHYGRASIRRGKSDGYVGGGAETREKEGAAAEKREREREPAERGRTEARSGY